LTKKCAAMKNIAVKRGFNIAFGCVAGKRNGAAILASLCVMLLVTGCVTEPGATVKDTSRTFTTVVIDPGHGGKDSGTWSKGRHVPLVFEKNLALDVGLKLDQRLREKGFHTVMTRRSDVFIELNDRARISNAQTNAIYVSIHFNDSPRRGIHGIETYYYSQASVPMAEKIEGKLDALPHETDRGVKHANFRVLKRNEYPAVLVECGYLSNRSEAVRAASPAYRQHLADTIAEAIYEQRYGAAALAAH
jgi:N-acetylmuramoyl-L-alanine amidase